MDEGREVVLGMRPEHLTLVDGELGFSAQVMVTEPTGSEVQILAKHGADDVVAVFRERFMPAPGQVIRLAPDLGHAHMFDAGTGQVLRA
jgi:multiple sugar transport system ATP-binding protein